MNSISGAALFNWYQEAKKAAIANNIEPAEVDWLLQTVTGLSSLALRLGSFKQQAQISSQKSLSELEMLWKKRLQKRLPVQYLVETVFWRRFQLKVTPAVLIPRPETELIVEIAQEAARHNQSPQSQQHWVDLGTGSGAIALGLRDIFPEANIHAVDLSQAALEIARENAVRLQLDRNLNFYCGSWWEPLSFLQGKVTGMVSNPPYIPTPEVAKLEPEVSLHEPNLALDGGVDGLDDIRYLVRAAPEYLASRGIWLIEIMLGQSDLVVELLKQQGEYYDVKVFLDLNGLERFVLAYRK